VILLLAKLLANVQLPRLFAFCQGFCPWQNATFLVVCIDPQKVQFKGFVNIDIETRWNSTYLMLNAAVKHKPTFAMLEMQDQTYVKEVQKGKGLPLPEDWEYVRAILPFLELFYNATVRISGSCYVTSSMYVFEVFSIG